MQVALLRRGTQDLFTSPAFMLHAFTARPEGEGDLAEDPPTTSGSAPPPHNIDIAKVTATYTALLQVLSHAAATLSYKAGVKVSLLCMLSCFEFILYDDICSKQVAPTSWL